MHPRRMLPRSATVRSSDEKDNRQEAPSLSALRHRQDTPRISGAASFSLKLMLKQQDMRPLDLITMMENRFWKLVKRDIRRLGHAEHREECIIMFNGLIKLVVGLLQPIDDMRWSAGTKYSR